MDRFSFKCKASELSGALLLVKIVKNATTLYEEGKIDEDTLGGILGYAKRSGDILGVNFHFGNPKFDVEIL